MGVLITPMALAHPLHPIRSKSRNQRRNLWVGWCVSSWRPWFWPVYSIYYIHIILHSCNLSKWKKNSFKETYTPKVGVAMLLACWMIWYCYHFLFDFKSTFHLFRSTFFISWYGCTMYQVPCDIVTWSASQSIGLFWGMRCSGVECH